MSLADALGASDDNTTLDPTSVVDSLMAQRMPDAAQSDGAYIDPQSIVNRLIRRGLMRPQQQPSNDSGDIASYGKSPSELGPNASPTGTTSDDLAAYGTNAGAGTTKGDVAVNDDDGAIEGAAQAAASAPVTMAGQTMKMAARGVPAMEQAEQGAFSPLNETLLTQPQNTEQSPLFKAGEATEQFGKEIGPSEATQKAHPIATAFGSGIGAVIPGVAMGAIDPALGIAGTAAIFGASSAEDTYEEAKNHGADDATATKAAGISGLVNAGLGSLPVANVLKPFARFMPKAAGLGMQILAQAVQNGVTFASVGEAQQYLGAQIAKMYDPKAGYSPDLERVIADFGAGAVLGAMHAAWHGKPAKPQQESQAQPQPTSQPQPGQVGLPPPEQTATGTAGAPGPGDTAGDTTGAPGGPAPEPNGGPGGAGATAQPQEPPQPSKSGLSDSVRSTLEDRAAFMAMAEAGMKEPAPRVGGLATPEVKAAYEAETKAWQDKLQQVKAQIASWSDDKLKAYVTSGMGFGSAANPAGMDAAQRAQTAQEEAAQQRPVDLKTTQDVRRAETGATEDQPKPATWNGLNISIEVPQGGSRGGVMKDGTPWTSVHPDAYGEIEGVPNAADGMKPDIIVGDHPNAPSVYVIDERDRSTAKYKQSKAFVGFSTPADAYRSYVGITTKSPEQVMGMRAFGRDGFVQWAKNGGFSRPASEAGTAEANGARTYNNVSDNLGPKVPPEAEPQGQTGPVAPSDEQREAIADAVRKTGIDPRGIRPALLEEAAEIHANEGLSPEDAYQLAVVRGLVADKLMTPAQVKEQYGETIANLLEEPHGTSGAGKEGVSAGARQEQRAGVRGVEGDASALQRSEASELSKLRREGDQSVPRVAGELRDVLRGHGAEAERDASDRAQRQRSGLQPGELSVGNEGRTSVEQAEEQAGTLPGRNTAARGSVPSRRSIAEAGEHAAEARNQTGQALRAGERRGAEDEQADNLPGRDYEPSRLGARARSAQAHGIQAAEEGMAAGESAEGVANEERSSVLGAGGSLERPLRPEARRAAAGGAAAAHANERDQRGAANGEGERPVQTEDAAHGEPARGEKPAGNAGTGQPGKTGAAGHSETGAGAQRNPAGGERVSEPEGGTGNGAGGAAEHQPAAESPRPTVESVVDSLLAARKEGGHRAANKLMTRMAQRHELPPGVPVKDIADKYFSNFPEGERERAYIQTHPEAAPKASTAPLLGEPVASMPEHKVTAADGTSVKVVPVIVDAKSLITSSDPSYDRDLQPRQRERAASQAQIREIAARLDPERLGYSAEADRGAPIVGPDGMVESGNGRVAAIRQVYQNAAKKRGPGWIHTAGRYEEWLKDQGVDIGKYDEPILVRQRRTDLTFEERKAFTVAANVADTLSMSAPERAIADARRITPAMLTLLKDGDLNNLENRRFVRTFLNELPNSERGALSAKDGGLSAEGLSRVRNAVLAKAYGDADILSRITESTDDEAKSVSNALVAAAPAWAKLRADIEAERVPEEFDLTKDLIEAVKRTGDLRAKGTKISEYLAQTDAFDQIRDRIDSWVRAFYDPNTQRAKSAARIADYLKLYAEEAAKVSAEAGLGLEMPEVTPHAILATAAKKTEPGPSGKLRQGESVSAGEHAGKRPAAGKGGRKPPSGKYGGKLGEPEQYFGKQFGQHVDLFTTEPGADNKPQLVIPGAEQRPSADLAKRRAAEPLKPRVAQKPLEHGLFGEEKNQTELFEAPGTPAKSSSVAGATAAKPPRKSASPSAETAEKVSTAAPSLKQQAPAPTSAKSRSDAKSYSAGKVSSDKFVDLGEFKAPPDTQIGQEAQRYVVERGRESGLEHLVAFDRDGSLVAHGRGTEGGIGLPPALEEALRDPHRSVVAHHNHPTNTSVSVADIRMLGFPGQSAIWAHGNGGLVARAALTQEARSALAAFSPDNAANRVGTVAAQVDRLLFGATAGAIERGAVSPQEADAALAHLVATALDRAGIIDYRSNIDASDFVGRAALELVLQRSARFAARSLFNEAPPDRDDGRTTALRHPGELGAAFGQTRTPAEWHAFQGRGHQEGKATDRAPESHGGQTKPSGYERPVGHLGKAGIREGTSVGPTPEETRIASAGEDWRRSHVDLGPYKAIEGANRTYASPEASGKLAALENELEAPTPAPLDMTLVRNALDQIDPALVESALAKRKPGLPPIKDKADILRQLQADLEDLRSRPHTTNIWNTPERLALQQQITDQLYQQHGHAQPIDRSPPVLGHRVDVVIGPPAAGKSTVSVEPLLKQYGGILVDSDEAKTLLPEYDNGRGANVVHEESARIAEEMLQARAVEAGANIVQPLVGKNLNKIDRLLKLYSEGGYEVHLHFVDLPVEKAVQRSITRYVETGRLLDPYYVEAIDHLPGKVYDELKGRPYVRSYERISTDVPFGQPSPVIEQGGPGADGLRGSGAGRGTPGHGEAEEGSPLALGDTAPRGWENADAAIYGHPEPGQDLGPFLPQPDVPLGAQAQDYVLGRGRVTGNEHLVAIDKSGSVDAHVEGNPRSVYIPPALNEHFYNPSKGIAVHHNHPSDSGLSDQDIAMLAAPGIHSVWAHGHKGTVSRAALTPLGRALMNGAPARNISNLGRLRRNADYQFIKPLHDPVLAGLITPERADHLIGYLSNEVLRRAGLIDYQTSDRYEKEIQEFGLQPYLDNAVRNLIRSVPYAISRGEAPAAGDDRLAGAFQHPGEMGAVFARPEGTPNRYTRPPAPNRSRGANGRAEAPRQLDLAFAETQGPFSQAQTAAGGGGRKPPGGNTATRAAASPQPPPRGAIVNAVTGTNLAKTFKNFWTSKFQPELVSARAFAADPLFARYRARGQQEKVAIVKRTEDDWNYWNKQPDSARIRFLDDVETAGFGNVPPNPREAEMARRYKKMLDENFQEEKKFGSKATYREDYFPHIWENEDDYQAYAQSRTAQLGPTWFQKERTIDYITDGLMHGLKLKYTNPIDILNHRLMSGVDMRQRMELLQELKKMGLAWEGKQGGEQLVRRGWRAVNAPDRQQWVIAPDVQALWNNAVEARSMWEKAGLGGGAFRSWMAVKSLWVPIKLTVSAFHPLHVLHIDQVQSLAQAYDLMTKNKDFGEAGKVAGEGLATIPTLGMIHYKRGRAAMQAWEKPIKDQTSEERRQTAIMAAAGYSPLPSEEMQIRAKRQLAVALAKIQRGEAGVADWRSFVSGAMRRPIEILQNPIFGKWIPALKTSALLRQGGDWLARHPDASSEDFRIAMRAIGKSIDNRFGEMNYGTLFWDRAIQDSAKAAMLSLGWNLGFVREFGGAAIEGATRLAGNLPQFTPTPGRAVAREATNKIPYALAYVGTAALLLGAMSWMLSGQAPSGWDFVFPRIGGLNPDGSPRRVTSMFYLREVPMLLKHVEQFGGGAAGVVEGAAQMLWDKSMAEPFNELWNNRDYYGYNIWDVNAPFYEKAWQAIKHEWGDQLSPMSMAGAKHAAQLSGKDWPSLAGATDKGAVLSYLGFGPAPAYVEKTALQNRIEYLYDQHVAPVSKPEEQGENTEDKMAVRQAILIAKRDHNSAGLTAAYARGRALGMKPGYMMKVGSEPTDVYLFSRLPNEDQKAILMQATPAERSRYWAKAHGAVKNALSHLAHLPPANPFAELH